MKRGKLSIEIDKLTACLEDATGSQLETLAYRIEDERILKGFTKKSGWYVNWAKLYKKYEIYALVLEESPSVFQGLCAIENDYQANVTILHWAVASPNNNLQKTQEKRYYGVGGHLFAIALEASIKAGFQGVVVGHPTNNRLYEHYINELGAKPFATSALSRNYAYTIVLDGLEARQLYAKYSFEEIKAPVS